MKNLPIVAISRILLLAGLLCSTGVMAIDGDMDYTAPYIMVDPDTGQVVTVNPGPRPKAHPDMGEDGPQSGASSTDVPGESTVARGEAMGAVTQGTSTTPAIIALWGALFYVIAGCLLARKTNIHNISTNSRHGNH